MKQDNDSVLDFVKSLQSAKAIIVPICLNGRVIHKGMKFSVSTSDYNSYINSTQNGKVSLTAASKEFLLRTVEKESRELLNEVLKVPGTLDHILPLVTNGATPDMTETLD